MTNRWNGWGEESVIYPLSRSAQNYLEHRLGKQAHIEDVQIGDVLKLIPDSNLPPHPIISTSKIDRLRHSRGQSLPDWIDLRYGTIKTFTDGVALPGEDEDVEQLIKLSYKYDMNLIPYGGGTSVLGHINPVESERPNVTIDTTRLNKITGFNERNQVALIGAGIRGPNLESSLNAQGYTLGHFPQSFEQSTLGGWLATRSCGQQSALYGRIEDMVRDIHIQTPAGLYIVHAFPGSAAGPDLSHAILGSEGRAGIITRASMIIQPLPVHEAFFGYFFREWEKGLEAVREIAQHKIPVSMMRLSDPEETEITLLLSGKEKLLPWADRGLRWLKYKKHRCLLIVGFSDQTNLSHKTNQKRASSVIRKHGGLNTGKFIGSQWEKNRFTTPYIRNTLWEKGYAIDTLETALEWSKVPSALKEIKQSIIKALEVFNRRVLVLRHISHVYPDGASLYFTYIFPRTAEPEETLEYWWKMKKAASTKIINLGGTISHQHGVGLDHLEYLPAEKGEIGLNVISAVLNSFDPKSLMNPGKLIK